MSISRNIKIEKMQKNLIRIKATVLNIRYIAPTQISNRKESNSQSEKASMENNQYLITALNQSTKRVEKVIKIT